MKYLKVFVVLTVLISFSGCDKVVEELANDNTVKLTKKLWIFESVTGYDDFNNQFFATFFTGMTYQFRPDGTYTAVILAQPNNSTWEFNSDKTVITLKPGDVDSVEWTITTLGETEFEVTFPDSKALTGIVTMKFK